MNRRTSLCLALAATLAAAQFSAAPQAFAQGGLHATSDRTVGGFVNPESVGCDVRGKALYGCT